MHPEGPYSPSAERPLVSVLRLAILAGLTVTAFWPLRKNGFISFDDPAYLTANSWVQQGLSADGVRQAFTSFRGACWHPLTWLSHMLDCQLFGLAPGAHHLHSLALHVLAVLLLFAWLRRMTGQATASWVAAALFAIHPLRVESVAWAAERKDVLGAAWWMLCTWQYAGYVTHPKRLRYVLLCLSFCAGLMAKPMLVTLPFALLLLDGWPLRRASSLRWQVLWPLVREKLPLILLAALSGIVTVVAEHAGQALVDWETYSLGQRLGNALIAYARYLKLFVWPADLAVLYPLDPASVTLWKTLAAALLLLALTAVALGLRRRKGFVLCGWLWFLGTLLPVSGVIQIGGHALADRFSYIPSVGLTIALVWSVQAAVGASRSRRLLAAVLTAVLLAALARGTYRQTLLWRSSRSLYTHTLAVTGPNYVIHTNLGIVLAQQGEWQHALAELNRALQLRPDFAMARNNRANVLMALGRADEALRDYRRAVALAPRNSRARNNLGLALMQRQQWRAAIRQLRAAVRLEPEYLAARNNLGVALAASGRTDDARACFHDVLKRDRRNPRALANLRHLRQQSTIPESP